MITAGWLQRRIERREERIRNEGRAEGGAEMQEKILGMLDENTRKEIERKLGLNRYSEN